MGWRLAVTVITIVLALRWAIRGRSTIGMILAVVVPIVVLWVWPAYVAATDGREIRSERRREERFQRKQAKTTGESRVLFDAAGKGLEDGKAALAQQIRSTSPEGATALDNLGTAEQPDTIRSSLETLFTIEPEFLDRYAADNRRQAAFMYHMLCYETANDSAERIVYRHRQLTHEHPQPLRPGEFAQRVTNFENSNPNWTSKRNKDAIWIGGLDLQRPEIDATIDALNSYLQQPT